MSCLAVASPRTFHLQIRTLVTVSAFSASVHRRAVNTSTGLVLALALIALADAAHGQQPGGRPQQGPSQQGVQQPTQPSEPWRIVALPQSSLVFGRDGSLIGETGREWRTNVALRSLPKYVGAAFIAVEDQRFYQHDGVDVIGVA